MKNKIKLLSIMLTSTSLIACNAPSTQEPTAQPTVEPTLEVTEELTQHPTVEPTLEVTEEQTQNPTDDTEYTTFVELEDRKSVV